MSVAAITLLALGAACSDSTYGGGGGGGGGGQGGRTLNVSVGSGGANAFVPAYDTVTIGSTVTWTWSSGTHNVTFETLPDTSTTKAAGTFQVAFGSRGTFRYRCTIHSPGFGTGMSGEVTVQ